MSNPNGAPRRHTDKEIAEALQETGGLIALTAKKLGYGYHAVLKRVRQSKTLQDAILASSEELVDIAEAKLKQATLNGEPWAILHVTKTKGKNRGYTERQEVTGADGAPITIRIVDDTDTAA